MEGAFVGRGFSPESCGRNAARDRLSVLRAGRATKKLHLAVPASPDSGAQARGSPRDAEVTREGGCQQGALGRPASQPRRAAPEPPGTPSPGSSRAPGGPAPAETIPFTVEAITITSQGILYRTKRSTLVAKRVGAGQTSPSPGLPAPDQAERSFAAKVFALLTTASRSGLSSA